MPKGDGGAGMVIAISDDLLMGLAERAMAGRQDRRLRQGLLELHQRMAREGADAEVAQRLGAILEGERGRALPGDPIKRLFDAQRIGRAELVAAHDVRIAAEAESGASMADVPPLEPRSNRVALGHGINHPAWRCDVWMAVRRYRAWHDRLPSERRAAVLAVVARRLPLRQVEREAGMRNGTLTGAVLSALRLYNEMYPLGAAFDTNP